MLNYQGEQNDGGSDRVNELARVRARTLCVNRFQQFLLPLPDRCVRPPVSFTKIDSQLILHNASSMTTTPHYTALYYTVLHYGTTLCIPLVHVCYCGSARCTMCACTRLCWIQSNMCPSHPLSWETMKRAPKTVIPSDAHLHKGLFRDQKKTQLCGLDRRMYDYRV